jgi:hypothetical protein
MIKNLLTIMLISVLVYTSSAQTQFENPGFELWEAIENGDVPEPVDWSSAASAEPDALAKLSPQVWDQSEDANTGDYSVYLVNKLVFSFVAPGIITNGRIHADLDPELGYIYTDTLDAQWNTPLTQRPDSIVGWYKANPQEGDFPTVNVLLHKGYGSFPQDDNSNWIAMASANLSTTEVSTWTRFSVPFVYFSEENPEYVLAILTSGNGELAVAQSEAWFDDLELIYNTTSLPEINDDQLLVSYSNEFLNVFMEQTQREHANLTITDISGRRVLVDEFVTGENHQIRFQEKTGVYFVTVKTANSSLTKKVFVQ